VATNQRSGAPMRCLNLGCGRRFQPQWTNVNFVAGGDGVIAHDLRKGIPFPDASFDVVYHSHVLEHFSQEDASRFLRECLRVLRPGGILRVVVPDLEFLARSYLQSLEQARNGEAHGAANLEWSQIHLFDQMVRNVPGGAMARYLSRPHVENRDYVQQQCGAEADEIMNGHRTAQPAAGQARSLRSALRMLRGATRDAVRILLGKHYAALNIGRFRESGEIHLWMYDQFSLTALLKECGAETVVKRTATESSIPEWDSFHLDTEPDGRVVHPESLCLEATRSGRTLNSNSSQQREEP
jgi:predicted SAM-dependent methyltransferase